MDAFKRTTFGELEIRDVFLRYSYSDDFHERIKVDEAGAKWADGASMPNGENETWDEEDIVYIRL